MEVVYSPSAFDLALNLFYAKNALETGERSVHVFSFKAEYNRSLIGGVTVRKRKNIFVLDYIAVEAEFRRNKIASSLLRLALESAAERGITELFFVTKAKDFFIKNGAVATEDNSFLMRECLDCPQRGETCSPLLMKFNINTKNETK
ncbi:MAG: GNAT family N-acetyltransferase [Eubacteriales bacterium]